MCGSPVEIEGYGVKSHRLVQSAVSLNCRSSFLFPQGSQLRVHGCFSIVK